MIFFSSPPAVRKWITPLGSEICYAHLDVKIRNRGHTCNFQLVMHQLHNTYVHSWAGDAARWYLACQMDSLFVLYISYVSVLTEILWMIHFKIFWSWSHPLYLTDRCDQRLGKSSCIFTSYIWHFKNDILIMQSNIHVKLSKCFF